jgi:hypothetical protein
VTVQHFPDLRAVQELFWKLITAPEGVAQGAAELHREGALESDDLSFLVSPDATLSSTERLDIYADMYFYRLRDCLAEDFPALRAHLGEKRFHNLVTDYLLAHPPTHFSLRELGRPLPGFLTSHPLERDFPALADLARLEWARVDVFDEADAVPLSREEVLERGTSQPERFVLALIPAARVLRLDVSVPSLWKRLDAGGGAAEKTLSPSGSRGETRALRVWRKGFATFHRSMQADEERCLEALASGGATLARLGELVAGAQPPDVTETELAERFAALLELWARDEILTVSGDVVERSTSRAGPRSRTFNNVPAVS